MTHSLAEQPQVAIRSRTNAALVFAFHSDLRRVPTKSDKPPKVRRRVSLDVADDPVDRPGALGTVGQVVKWGAMLAAIAAPWVLLLTG